MFFENLVLKRLKQQFRKISGLANMSNPTWSLVQLPGGDAYEKECEPVLKEFQSFSKPDMSSIQEKFLQLQKNAVEIGPLEAMDRFSEDAEKVYVQFLHSSDKKSNAHIARGNMC